MFGKFKKFLSPSQGIAAIVDAVADRLNDKYRIEGSVWMEGGGFRVSVSLVDINQDAKKVNLDESVEE